MGDCYIIGPVRDSNLFSNLSFEPQKGLKPSYFFFSLLSLPALTMGIGTRRLCRGQLKSTVPVEPVWQLPSCCVPREAPGLPLRSLHRLESTFPQPQTCPGLLSLHSEKELG